MKKEIQYLVIQKPKPKFREAFKTTLVVVTAVSARAAVLKTGLKANSDFSKPYAEPLIDGGVLFV